MVDRWYSRLYLNCPAAAMLFSFPDSLLGLHRPAVRHRPSSTLPKDKVVVAPSKL
jgi:hypothetical protein